MVTATIRVVSRRMQLPPMTQSILRISPSGLIPANQFAMGQCAPVPICWVCSYSAQPWGYVYFQSPESWTRSALHYSAIAFKQIAACPAHLIVDLQMVRFLGSSGLNCLLDARELVQQVPRTQLHIAGLVTRAVARPLQTTGLAGPVRHLPHRCRRSHRPDRVAIKLWRCQRHSRWATTARMRPPITTSTRIW